MEELKLTPQEEGKEELSEGEGQETDLEGKEEPEETESQGKEEEGEKEEGEKEEEKEEEDSLEALLKARDDEIRELRQLLREGKRSIDELKNRVDTSEKVLDEAGILPEKDKEALEEQQKAIAARERELDLVLEMTRLNPSYSDVDTVVSQSNFDDMIEAMAHDYAEQNKVTLDEATAEIEAWVWSKTNPYRYMYDLIKKHHPNYAAKQEEPKVKEAPGSIQAPSGGASSDSSGWTAAKIDGLPEDELSKVPRDIYTKYLMGKLK